jgi:hypothetical protein
MVLIDKGKPNQFSMDGFLHSNLSYAKEKIKDDWDFIFCIDGGERKGKSVLTQQLAYFCDPSFNLDRIVFTPNQFKEAILTAKPYQAVVYDEAYGGINSRATMSKVNRSIVKMLTEIGSRNLFVFIVLPCFFDLDRYVALWRSKGLFHVYVNEKLERGFFTAYNEDTKKDLYIYGKKFMNYNAVKSNFYGRFPNKWIVDKELYEKKKREAQLKDDDEVLVFDEAFRQKMVLFNYNNDRLKGYENKANALNMSVPNYFVVMRKYKDLLRKNFEEFKIEDFDDDKAPDDDEESENIK